MHNVHLNLKDDILLRVPFYKYLGVFLDSNLTFNKHIDVSKKLNCQKLSGPTKKNSNPRLFSNFLVIRDH